MLNLFNGSGGLMLVLTLGVQYTESAARAVGARWDRQCNRLLRWYLRRMDAKR